MQAETATGSREEQINNLHKDERELLRRIAAVTFEINRIENELINVQEAARKVPTPSHLSSNNPDVPYEPEDHTQVTSALRKRVLDDEHGTDQEVLKGIQHVLWRVDRLIKKDDKLDKPATNIRQKVPRSRVEPQFRISRDSRKPHSRKADSHNPTPEELDYEDSDSQEPTPWKQAAPKALSTHGGIRYGQKLISTRLSSLRGSREEFEVNLKEVRERLKILEDEQQVDTRN